MNNPLTQLLQRRSEEQRAESTALWMKLGKIIISNLDLGDVLKAVIQVINEKMNVETGSILLLDPATQELTFAEILHGDQRQFAGIRLGEGQGVAGWVVQNRRSAIVTNPAQDTRFFAQVDEQTGFHTRSILCVPLIVMEQVIGAIQVLNKRQGTFNRQDLVLLESIAAPVAIAIQNARLRESVEQHLTEQTELLRKIQRAKEDWESSIDTIDEGILLIDHECSILRVNRVFAAWASSTPSELVGKHCYEVVHGLDASPARCPHSKALASAEQSLSAEFEEPHLGRTVRLTAYPLRGEDGNIQGTVNVLKDVTAEKQLHQQLIQTEKLAATGRMAASFAHEINNPLQAIQGCLDLASSNIGDPAKQERYLGLAIGELARLKFSVQHMLDFSRISKGDRTPVQIRKLLDDVLALEADRLDQAQVQVRLDWDDEIPKVMGEGNQLKQVFLNLILNAIESMPQGGRLSVKGQVVDKSWVTVAFADSGVGIFAKDMNNIFDPFFTTKTEGTGLGLAVSHNIVTGHGGHFTVESEPGGGSVFAVWLPMEA